MGWPAIVMATWLGASSPVAPLECPPGAAPRSRTTEGTREDWCETASGGRHGPRRAFYSDGARWFEGQYDQGARVGPWRFWHPSGHEMLRQTFVVDRAHGDLVRFREDGTKSLEGRCHDGREDGEWKSYWPNGKLEVVVQFVDGERKGDVRFFSRRGVAVALDDYLRDKTPGLGPGSDRHSRARADAVAAVVFNECRQ